MNTYKAYFIPGVTDCGTIENAKSVCDDEGPGTYGIIEVTYEAEDYMTPPCGSFSMTGVVSYTVEGE